MLFKRLLMVSIAAILVFGCAGENQFYQKKEKLSFGKTGGKCLTDFGNTIDKYVNNELRDLEVNLFWDCVYDSLDMFGTFINGNISDYYTAAELQRFLNTFFMNEGASINDELMSELMMLKRIFIGGSKDNLTKLELEKSKGMIEMLRRFTIQANPYIGLYTFSGGVEALKQKYSSEDLEKAIQVVQGIASEFGDKLNKNKISYKFSDFKKLLELLNEEVSPKALENADIIDFVPVSAAIKTIFVGPDIERIGGNEWRDFFVVVGELYEIGLRGFYYLDENDWSRGESFSQIDQVVKQGFNLLEKGLEVNDDDITYEKLNELISRATTLVEIPFGISTESAQMIVEIFIGHVLKPITLRDQYSVAGFNSLAFTTLKNEYARWKETQLYINDSFDKPSKPREYKPLHDDDLYTPVEELTSVIDLPIRLLQHPDGRLNLSYETRYQDYDHFSLTMINWQKAIARMLIKGYASDPDSRKAVSGVNLDEYKKAFFDFGDIMLGLGIVRPLEGENGEQRAVEKFADESFVEASLFLPGSFGDRIFSLQDGMQYINYAGTGLIATLNLFDYLINECHARNAQGNECLIEYKDPEDLESEITGIDVNLFREMFSEHSEVAFGHMSSMHNYYSSLNGLNGKKTKADFLKLMEKSIGGKAKRDQTGIFTRSEAVRLIVVLQYVETFFMVYDYNEDLQLVYNEASVAYPKFEDYLQEISDDIDSDKRAESMFYYLIAQGKVPVTLAEKLKYFLEWESQPKKWKTAKGDRFRILKILATLQEQNEATINK